MHPISTVLFLLGYALALPTAAKFSTLIANRQRLGLWGHQFGVFIAAVGWLSRGQVLVAVGHLAWMIIANVWYELGTRRRARRARAESR